MPRYNRAGMIAAGVAGGTVTRAGVVIASPAGGAVWLDDARILYGRKVGEPDQWGLRTHDGQRESKVEAEDTPATDICAGGAVWAVWSTTGIRSNSHPPLPMAGLHDVAPDGTLAFCADRQDGRGLILRALDGTQTVLVPPVAACRDVQAHDARNATWTQGGRIRSTYGDPVTPAGVCGVPRVVTRQGQRFLLYFYAAPNGREYLLCQTDWTQPVGYIVTQEGRIDWPAHRPDLMDVDTVLRACWATSEGEGPSSIRETAVNMAAPVVDFRTLATPSPSPAPSLPSPTPSPSPSPVPHPTPTNPEPTPVATPVLPQAVKDILVAFGDRFAALRKGSDDDRRAFTGRLASQLALSVDPGWGTKRASLGRPLSKDAIARVIDGTLWGWDIINGATREVMPEAQAMNLTDPPDGPQVFVAVTPQDWLGLAPAPPVPVPTPPPPAPVPVPLPPVPPVCEFAPCDLSAINARLDRIEAALLALVVQSARPRPVTLSGSWVGRLNGEVGAPKL